MTGTVASPAGEDELDVLEDRRRRTVRFRDKDLVVVPLKVRQLAPFARAARLLIEEFAAQGAVRVNAGFDSGLILGWIDKHFERLVAAAAIAVDAEPEWIGEGEIDQLEELVFAIIAVNVDFFVRRLLQKLRVVGAELKTGGSGRTPSKT